jgi:hypothetical protein
MRANLEDNRARGLRIDSGWTLGSVTGVLTANQQLSIDHPTMTILAATQTAQNVRLPPASGVGAADVGAVLIFVNLSGAIVTLQTSGGAGFATAITVPANGSARVVCTGNATPNLGWLAW